MAEGKKILLLITGTQFPPREEWEKMSAAEREAHTVITRMQVEAEYYGRGEHHYYLYEEQPEGFPVPVKTCIKCREGYAEMIRRGSMGSRMVFETGKQYRTEYPTPYGKLLLDVAAQKVQIAEIGEVGCPQVRLEYILKNEEQQIGSYLLSLEPYLIGFAPPFS